MKSDRQDRQAKVQTRKDEPGTPGKRPSDFPWVKYSSTQCPNCGSMDTHVTRSEKKTRTLVHRIHKCKNCGASFNSEQEVKRVDQAPDKPGPETEKPTNATKPPKPPDTPEGPTPNQGPGKVDLTPG